MGLTAGKGVLTQSEAGDPRRLAYALALTPACAALLYLSVTEPLTLIAALPALIGLTFLTLPMRRYFIAFSPRNAFPRNLPAFARWAALYSGAMLVMIVVPPSFEIATRAAIWLTLAAACLLYPLFKAWRRARAVWAE
ncbi:MAG: hypothetical protein AAF618_10005 [Pseudomonadota bacterium]